MPGVGLDHNAAAVDALIFDDAQVLDVARSYDLVAMLANRIEIDGIDAQRDDLAAHQARERLLARSRR